MVELACAAIVFDLDGVLVDSSVVVERHWRRWAEVVVEDAPAGVAAAHAAGMRAIAVLTTHDRAGLAGAELIVPGIGSLHIDARSAWLAITARVTAPSA